MVVVPVVVVALGLLMRDVSRPISWFPENGSKQPGWFFARFLESNLVCVCACVW